MRFGDADDVTRKPATSRKWSVGSRLDPPLLGRRDDLVVLCRLPAGRPSQPGTLAAAMSEPTQSGFPRRDAHGRVSTIVDLLGVALAGIVLGVAILALFDGVLAALGRGDFGQANGWLGVILPAWLFVEEFRAWRTGTPRSATFATVVALVSAGVGVTLGLLAAGATSDLPPLASGALGATAATLGYALLWFYGVRWTSRRFQ